MPSGREAVAWGDVLAILTIGRLCEPSSELAIELTARDSRHGAKPKK